MIASAAPQPPRSIAAPDVDDFMAFLDDIAEELQGSPTSCHDAMNRLSDGLWWFRRENPGAWPARVADALAHPLRALVHEDPFTRHAFDQPRGYAGDAALLDFIYYDRGGVDLARLGDRGRAIYRRNRDAPAPQAVRERRDHLASLIDRTALRRPGARILAVACGHLREGLQSHALGAARRTTGEPACRLDALDQDSRSLAEVTRCFDGAVQCRAESIRSLLAEPEPSERYDLVYAAGLYDYLNDRTAARLTARLFDRLASEGELVVANFLPDVADAGYMESYMGWRLVWRTIDQVQAMAADLPRSAADDAVVYELTTPDIAYLQVQRT